MTDEPKRQLPLLVKISATAYEFSTSIGSIYEMVKAGELDLVKLGPKSSRITSSSIERVLARRDKPATSTPNLKQARRSSA